MAKIPLAPKHAGRELDLSPSRLVQLEQIGVLRSNRDSAGDGPMTRTRLPASRPSARRCGAHVQKGGARLPSRRRRPRSDERPRACHRTARIVGLNSRKRTAPGSLSTPGRKGTAECAS